MPLRATAFKRCLTNLVDNAMRFGDHVTMRAGMREDRYEITIDDDGPEFPWTKDRMSSARFFGLKTHETPSQEGSA